MEMNGSVFYNHQHTVIGQRCEYHTCDEFSLNKLKRFYILPSEVPYRTPVVHSGTPNTESLQTLKEVISHLPLTKTAIVLR